MKRKVLCTGTGGFIMSNFIRKAIYEGQPYEFVSIDNATKTSALNNIYSNKNHKFYIADITDQHIINTIFEIERPDVVINGAAQTHVDDAIKNPYLFIDTNIKGTQIITDACVKWGCERMIQVSSDEVYGALKSESESSWTESSPMSPRNSYSMSKAAGEMIVKVAHEAYGLQYNITRSSNNYGPRQTGEKFIPKCIANYLTDKPIPIYGAGDQIRDWTHVFDNCAGLLTVLGHGMANETYNISANQEYSNIEVAYEIVKILNESLGQDKGKIEHIKDRIGHDFRYSIDSSKIRALGWKPDFKFKQGGIKSCVNWYLNNRWAINT